MLETCANGLANGDCTQEDGDPGIPAPPLEVAASPSCDCRRLIFSHETLRACLFRLVVAGDAGDDVADVPAGACSDAIAACAILLFLVSAGFAEVRAYKARLFLLLNATLPSG